MQRVPGHVGHLSFVLLLGCAQAACSADARDTEARQSEGLLGDAKTVATAQASITAEGVDCRSFEGYSASLATLTVDCLGTIRPDSYAVSASGVLERNFSSCALDATTLSSIDSILSLQHREARLPHVKECLAGHYADFVRGFASTGVTACPEWRKERTVNPITESVIDAVAPRLKFLSDRQVTAEVAGHPSPDFAFPEELEEKNLYRASFAALVAPEASASPAASAAACAGGFAGFVLEAAGSSVLTDPQAWLLDTTYPTASADPYLRPGYWHPMSYWGGVPGVSYGNPHRAKPCPDCPAEYCSYWTGSHKITRLQLDCNDPNDWDTCVSYCGPLQLP